LDNFSSSSYGVSKKRKVAECNGDDSSEQSNVSDSDSDSEESQDDAVNRAEDSSKAAQKWLSEQKANTFIQPELSEADENTVLKRKGSPFKRVDAEEWNKEIKAGLEDNSYVNQFGGEGYGAKANKVLATVKGKDFRHEKTKRKRSTYRGGTITLSSNSYKYTD